MKATLSADRKNVRLRGKIWGESFLLEKLPSRLAFYRRLAELPKAPAGTYEPTIKALAQVQAQLEEQE